MNPTTTQPSSQMQDALKNALTNVAAAESATAAASPPASTAVAAPTTAKKVAPSVPAKKVVKPAETPKSSPPAGTLDVGQVIARAAAGGTTSAALPEEKLPAHLTVGGKDNKVFTLEIFGTGCLTCRALVQDPDLEPMEELPNCHFSRGVALCPAEKIQIRPVGEQRLMANKLRKAQEDGKTQRFTRLMAELASRPEDFQNEVLILCGIQIRGATASQ